ncbi:MAG: hypothetical protein AB7H93_05715 [Vicinamibacterales bacterium]
MNRFVWLLAVTIAVLVGSIATRAQFETPNRAFHGNTAFPLTGRHQTVACESCHTKGVFKGTPTACYDCHWVRRQDDKFKTQLGTQCENCHRTIAWTAVRWDHGAMTNMPLNGAHRAIGCESCHASGRFQKADVSCVSCHQKDYAATKTPNHVAAGFPMQCEACHRPSDVAFTQARFDHEATFPLAGTHATVACATCHRNSVFQGTPRDCIGCHRTDYERTAAPNHAAAGFPTACESCHRPTDPGWRGVNFNHSQFFTLVGSHQLQECTTCHKNNVFKGTARDCAGCHLPQYQRTAAPNHAQAGFPTTCETCHRPTDANWTNGTFNHTSVYPLAGQHAAVQCAVCHTNGVFRGTARDCVGCHRTDYERTTAPNHAQAGIPTTCENCHRSSDPSWRSGSFNHNQVFGLVGRHASAACTSCHVNGVFRGTARDCAGCHRSQYERTTAPNHAQAGFSTQCESCHRAGDNAWTGVSFNHNQFFALQGVHASQSCATCHRGGTYKGTPRTCVGCHQADYTATRNPNHAQSGFPTTCDNCHRATDTAWTQGRFTHTRFPLSGRHNVACSQCHTPSPPAFSCLTCHLRPQMDDKHRNRTGYRYDSAACYSCHPNGRDD